MVFLGLYLCDKGQASEQKPQAENSVCITEINERSSPCFAKAFCLLWGDGDRWGRGWAKDRSSLAYKKAAGGVGDHHWVQLARDPASVDVLRMCTTHLPVMLY